MEIEPVTDRNRAAVLALAVRPEQRRHIETTAECLEEAAQSPAWRPVALYDGGDLVGFAMYGLLPAWIGARGEMQVWLDRLLIDARYQGRGLGEAALEALLGRLGDAYGHTPVYLSVYGDNIPAIRLYEKHGFAFTGALDTKGEKVMRREAR